MSEREQFEAWWKTTGRALCGCSLVPDHTSPNQVFAARGFGAGFAAGFEAARAQPAQASDLVERCREILAWKATGLLPGNALRSFAERKWGDDHMALSLAEADTMKEALEMLVSQPAQAGQVLTDAELAALMPPPDIDGSKARSPNAVRMAMRAVEAAVLAKRVPMTDDTALIRQLAVALDRCRFDSLNMSVADMRALSEARTAASKRLGIGGEKGGA